VRATFNLAASCTDKGEVTSRSHRPSSVTADCVLVVDDEPPVRQLVAGILTRAGHRVVTASCAAEALRLVEEEPVVVVLTDINMPGSISGLELIDEVHKLRPSLPIIPVTGSADELNLHEALDRGAAGFITKPFKADELRRKVAGALTRLSLVEDELRERVLAPTVASVLANAIEVRDAGMEGHTERLAALALEIGRRLSVSESDLEALSLGAVLHDVGKIGIPDAILMKPGRLTPDERRIIQQHPVIGDRMLEPIALLDAVRPIVLHHHERWDGDGYPSGLREEHIPLLARIVAIADSIEAMSGARPYRSPLSGSEIEIELDRGRGRQWDARLVEIALELIATGQLSFEQGGMRLQDAP
jgi:putative two-component system response regulator